MIIDFQFLPNYDSVRWPSRPRKATAGSSGYDCVSCVEALVRPNETVSIPIGLKLRMPRGVEAQIRSRSGLTMKYGIVVANGIGTIDSDYRDEIAVLIRNNGRRIFRIERGMRIAQMVFSPVYCDDLCPYHRFEFRRTDLSGGDGDDENQNGSRRGGFGSTGDYA